MISLVTGLLWQNNRFCWTNRPWRLPGSQESAPCPRALFCKKDLFQYGSTSGNILGLVTLNEMLILTDCLDSGSLCACVWSHTLHMWIGIEFNPKNHKLKERKKNNLNTVHMKNGLTLNLLNGINNELLCLNSKFIHSHDAGLGLNYSPLILRVLHAACPLTACIGGSPWRHYKFMMAWWGVGQPASA